MNVLKIFAIVCGTLLTTACANTTTPGSATEAEICFQWGDSLPTRSRSDTAQTKDEIQQAYSRFALVCPDHKHLIP